MMEEAGAQDTPVHPVVIFPKSMKMGNKFLGLLQKGYIIQQMKGEVGVEGVKTKRLIVLPLQYYKSFAGIMIESMNQY